MEKIENKIFAFVILGFLLFSALGVSIVNAEEDLVLDNGYLNEEEVMLQIYKDESLIGPMNSGIGAEVRLLQLERHVQKNYLTGKYILEGIDELNIDIDSNSLDELKEIVNDLDDLREEIESERDNVSDGDYDAQDVVDKFLELKDDAKFLSADFRTIVHEELTISEIEDVLEFVRDQDFSSLDDYDEEIRELIIEQHKERVEYILNLLDINDDELLDRIESGDITIRELREILNEKYNELSSAEKKEFREKMTEYREQHLGIIGSAIGKRLGLGNEFQNVFKNKELKWSEKKAKFKVMVRDKVHKNFGEGRGNEYGKERGGGRFK